jgi:putative redox protein
VTARTHGTGYRTVVRSGDHVFVADEPVSAGGTEEGASPYDYLLGAAAACTSMTLRMYAQRKGWPLEEAIVDLRTRNSHAADCEACAEPDVQTGPGVLERRIELRGPLSEEQRVRLLQIADRCPVKQTLERGVRIVNGA